MLADGDSRISPKDGLRRGTGRRLCNFIIARDPAFDVEGNVSDHLAKSPRSRLLGRQTRCGQPYGFVRYNIRGNAIVSRTCSRPQIQATQRSIPMPNPPWGTVP